MQQHEFHNLGELEETQLRLARASEVDIKYQDPTETDFPCIRSIDGYKGILNERSGEIEYIGSETYTLSQHSEVIDAIRAAVDQTVGEINMGIVRDWGSKVQGTLVFDEGDGGMIDVAELVGEGYVPPDHHVDPYGNERARDTLGLGMRFTNSFDGTTKITGSTMGYRYICQNWMVWGEETIGVTQQRHVSSLSPDMFEGIIFEVLEKRDEAEQLIVNAVDEEIPTSWVDSILDQVGFGPTYRKWIMNELVEYNQPREGYTSIWNIYNAVTHELDHTTLDRTRPERYDDYQEMAENIIAGNWVEPQNGREIEMTEVLA